MDTMMAYTMNQIARREGSPMRQLDWEKAKEICEQNKGKEVYAGLQDDMEWTGGCIFDGEKQVRDYVYVASCWATPILAIDGVEIECWVYGRDNEMPKWWGA